MATPDHTSPLCPPKLSTVHPPLILGRVLQHMGHAEQPQQQRAAALSGIAFTNHTSARVLNEADAFCESLDDDGCRCRSACNACLRPRISLTSTPKP